MCDATGLSQRRACRLTGLSLSTCRYEAQRPAADVHLSGRITELALERRRFGYRRIWQLLRREGLHVNHKRVYRLYHLSGLGVKRRRRRKGLAIERLPLLRPAAPNLTWSMDFVMDALATGRRIKCLTCVDDFTKECLTITVRYFRRSGHAYSGQHHAVSGVSDDNKNRSGPGIYLPRARSMGL